MKNNEYTIRCTGHTYITLEWNGKFVFCLDNDFLYAEEMIYKIEKRTQMNFQDIPIIGSKDDFSGLRFFNGGWKCIPSEDVFSVISFIVPLFISANRKAYFELFNTCNFSISKSSHLLINIVLYNV